MTMPGRMRYVPFSVIDEAEDIRAEKNLRKVSDAMREMVRYSQLGREAERIVKLDFRWRPRNVSEEKSRRKKWPL
jgi:hypothetical protein